jgi:hypothetical protein
MHLSNRDILYAIDCGKLLVRPRPKELGSSIARWDERKQVSSASQRPESRTEPIVCWKMLVSGLLAE